MHHDQSTTFSALMLLVQQGDEDALEALLDGYGEAIRREIRFTLLDRRLRCFVGDSDVYQSVVMRFFSGVRDGHFQIESSEDLVCLLKGIARTRIAELVRYWHSQRRDLSRNVALPADASDRSHQAVPRPLEALELEEIIESMERVLTATDRQILRWRDEDMHWSEIALRLEAGSGEAVRKQHERALAKIAKHFAAAD